MELADREALLLETLRIAVPMWITQHDADPPGPTRRAALIENVGAHGDSAMFLTKTTPITFNALAEGLAILARAPGGVTFLGEHWCTDHAVCEAAEQEATP